MIVLGNVKKLHTFCENCKRGEMLETAVKRAVEKSFSFPFDYVFTVIPVIVKKFRQFEQNP